VRAQKLMSFNPSWHYGRPQRAQWRRITPGSMHPSRKCKLGLAHHGMSSPNLPCPIGVPRTPVGRTQTGSIDKHLLKLCKLDGRRGVVCQCIGLL
jgi:hypothetical protein